MKRIQLLRHCLCLAFGPGCGNFISHFNQVRPHCNSCSALTSPLCGPDVLFLKGKRLSRSQKSTQMKKTLLTLSMPACFPVLATHCSGAELNCSKLHAHIRTKFIAISLYLDGFSRSMACWKDLDNRKPFQGLTARQAYQGHFHLLSKSPYHA